MSDQQKQALNAIARALDDFDEYAEALLKHGTVQRANESSDLQAYLEKQVVIFDGVLPRVVRIGDMTVDDMRKYIKQFHANVSWLEDQRRVIDEMIARLPAELRDRFKHQ